MSAGVKRIEHAWDNNESSKTESLSSPALAQVISWPSAPLTDPSHRVHAGKYISKWKMFSVHGDRKTIASLGKPISNSNDKPLSH